MQVETALSALQQTLSVVGVSPMRIPTFYSAADYSPSIGRRCALDVVVVGEGVDVYEYSDDIREPPLTKKHYKSMLTFIRAFVAEQIEHAATIYMGTERNDLLEKVKKGSSKEFFETRQQFRLTRIGLLENYLRSDEFAAISGLNRFTHKLRTQREGVPPLAPPIAAIKSPFLVWLWAAQGQVPVAGNFLVSVFLFLCGFVWIYFAENDMVRFQWRTFEFLHSTAIFGYWVIAIFCFLLAVCAVVIMIQQICRLRSK
ncbi:MAG TPA: hypothetical protein VK629_17510 [Steroidobacteraceae bacterium]|nr:hypothetical protein [Steroidobacteraceae bacterium]